MESTDKLREWCRLQQKPNGSYPFEVLGIADEIEREIAERFMELPVDADGVPINVGDMLIDTRFNEPFEVWAIIDNQGLVSKKLSVCPTMYLKHVKPRTIEDVLEEFLIEFDDWDWNTGGNDRDNARKQLFAKYADELRSMGVGE